MRTIPTLLLAVLSAPILGGCLSTSPIAIESTLQTTYTFDHTYTWSSFLSTDASGNVTGLVPYARNATDLPLAVERLVQVGGSEPNIGFDSKGSAFVTNFDYVMRTDDHGATWKKVHDFATPGYPVQVDRWETFSTSLWVDHPTDRVLLTNLYADDPRFQTSTCSHLSYSEDQGASWTERPLAFCHAPRLMSYAKVATGPASKDALVPGRESVPGAFPNNLYLCALVQAGGVQCAVSLDGGLTYAYTNFLQRFPVDLAGDAPCVPGVFGHPAIAPNGHVAVPIGYWATVHVNLLDRERCGNPLTVFVSDDNGLTWEARTPGNAWNSDPAPDIAFDKDGVGYLVFRKFSSESDDQAVFLYRSPDNFKTWEGPYRVSPVGLNITVYNAVTSGDPGRIAVAYLGTRSEEQPHAQSWNASVATNWDMFVTTSFDAKADAPHFLTQQVTPVEDPLQVGRINQGLSALIGQGGPQVGRGIRDMLGFIDISADAEGRFMAAFTDGCSTRSGCTTDTQGGWAYRDRQLAVAVLDGGQGLKEGVTLPFLGLQHADPKPRVSDNPIPQ